LKFSDVVIATASALVIYWLSYAVLSIMFVSVPILHVPAYVSPLIAAVVVGYVFAGKIREESRMRSIGKIVVLFTVLVELVFYMYYMYYFVGHTSPSSVDIVAIAVVTALSVDIVAIAVVTALLGFVGLYVGSMRKLSAKTKK
jgi:4-amino-4-deoxy-L-arabinose transferase-like glycosyltransferase